MPIRTPPLVNNEIYHVYNKSISFTSAFVAKRDYQRLLEIFHYYQFENTPLSFSKFAKHSIEVKNKLLEKLSREDKRLIRIFCFCFMSNHFHLLLRQKRANGISKFMGNLQNSYTRYFNLRNKRVGPLFRGAFKAVRIKTDEQFLHISRYIHLNPYSSGIVKTFRKLERYPWSSLGEYLSSFESKLSFPDEVLAFFKSPQEYRKFVFDQADYQRELEKIKHVIIEDDRVSRQPRGLT